MASLALAACGSSSGGGSDADAVRTAITDFAAANDKSVCDMVTQRFLEAETGKKGDAARKACEKQASGPKKAPKVTFQKVTVNGDRATVIASAQGDTGSFVLLKQDGDWKIDSVKSADQASSGGSGTTTTSTTSTSTTPSGTPTKQEYIAKVTPICSATKAQYVKLNAQVRKAKSLPTIASALDAFTALAQSTRSRLGDVTPPAGDATQVGTILGTYDAIISTARKTSAAAKARQSRRVQTLATQLPYIGKRYLKLARAYGFPTAGVCGPSS